MLLIANKQQGKKDLPSSSYFQQAFTIVELLIVIVVIAILAAVAAVAYNGMQSRARSVSLLSDAHQAGTQLELIHADTGSYPASISPATVEVSSGNQLDYTLYNDSYCLAVTNTHGSSNITSILKGKSDVGPCPVGHWAMNGNAQDSSIYKNHGAADNVTPTTDRHGNSNGAYSFGAVGSRIMLANPIGGAGFTSASLWFKRDGSVASSNWRTILAHASSNIHPLIIDSSWKIAVFDGSTRLFGYTIPNDNQWMHIAAIYDSVGLKASLYVNGAHISTIGVGLNLNTNPIGQIGNWSGSGYHAGLIDDVRIYNRALSASEIKQLYETN